MSETPAVTVSGATCHFDVSPPWLDRVLRRAPRRILRAVEDVSFSVPRGKTFSVVGESGCGKSTLARMMVGLQAPTAGSISFGTVTRPDGSVVPPRVQMIFQDPYASLNPRWRVGDIIAEPIRELKLMADEAHIAARIAELLKTVGLSPADARRFPHEFSGGQRQRISIARALATEADILVCDEPTSALDVSVQAQILNLMRRLQQQFGLTYLFISHNLSVVRHMSDEIAIMYLGRFVETGRRTKSLPIRATPIPGCCSIRFPMSRLQTVRGCRWRARCRAPYLRRRVARSIRAAVLSRRIAA